MNTALRYTNVTIRYSECGPAAVNSVSLHIEKGQRVALLGLNGSGKTTLLNAATGLIVFDGSIEVDGIPLTKKTTRQIRDTTGLLFSNPDDQLIFPNVLDDVAFSLERRRIPRDEAISKAKDILKSLGVGAQAELSPHILSQGQRQRVALAGLLAASPSLLLLDEPSTSLDPVGREELAQLLTQQNAAILMATHDISFAMRICERFVILRAGEIYSDSSDPETAIRYEKECISVGADSATVRHP